MQKYREKISAQTIVVVWKITDAALQYIEYP